MAHCVNSNFIHNMLYACSLHLGESKIVIFESHLRPYFHYYTLSLENLQYRKTRSIQLRALGFQCRVVASTLHLIMMLEKILELNSEGSVCITSWLYVHTSAKVSPSTIQYVLMKRET